MRPISNHWAISVTVTDRCGKSCAHCTRGVRQVKRADARLSDIETALQSLKNWRGGVACLGGEPVMHSDFIDICHLWARFVPKWRGALFTADRRIFKRYRDLVYGTFGIVNYNDHHNGSWHQPLFAGYRDMGISRAQFEDNRRKCWLHWHWCPEVKPGIGAYHCEVAATLDTFLTGNKRAMPVEVDWWKRPIPQEQLEICEMCGVSHNLPAVRDTSKAEYITASWIPFLPENAYRVFTSPDDFPERHTPRHYAEPDGKHYIRKRTFRIFLRQKWYGAGYHIRKRLFWPLEAYVKKICG